MRATLATLLLLAACGDDSGITIPDHGSSTDLAQSSEDQATTADLAWTDLAGGVDIAHPLLQPQDMVTPCKNLGVTCGAAMECCPKTLGSMVTNAAANCGPIDASGSYKCWASWNETNGCSAGMTMACYDYGSGPECASCG